MNNIIYYFLIIPISYLPNSILYGLSNISYLILARLIKYRNHIITKNLKNSFPNKPESVIIEIKRSFYKHFCDLIFESLKGFSISQRNIENRIKINNQELLNSFAEKGKNVVLIGGHYNNWEMTAQRMPLVSKHDLFAIYKPLRNKFYDKKMRNSREKFGLKMIPMNKTKYYFENKSKNPRAIIFGSDQSPSNIKKAHWINFLNQDTGFLFGAEKYSKEFNWPVIYVSIQKVKRGSYEVDYKLLTEDPISEPNGNIIKKFANFLENDINNNPPFWLWTHNRWKKKID